MYRVEGKCGLCDLIVTGLRPPLAGCRPDERNLRSRIFKSELCIPCYYRERADHLKKNRSLAQKLENL